jgi:trehalose 6-phosphate phosphatase
MRRDTSAVLETPDPLDPLRAEPGQSALLCDIDGTLAPIVGDPEAARVGDETRAVLAELASRYLLVACISGRRASAARRMVGLAELSYAGNHGLELLGPGEVEPRLEPALRGHEGAAAGFVSRLDWRALGSCGLRLEDKGPIQAIHWRGAADPEVASSRARELAERAAEDGLAPHVGRMVLELRPPIPVDKGVATRRLVEDAGAAMAMFGGDDRTDLDAFAALRQLAESGALERGVCVGVASAEGPPEIKSDADLLADGTDGFLKLLRSL